MKPFFAVCFATYLLLAYPLCGFSRIERFDISSDIHGKLQFGSQVKSERGSEKGALVVNGINVLNQNFYVDEFPVTPGRTYVYSLQYNTSAKIANQSFVVQVLYYDGTGKHLAGQNAYSRMAPSPHRYTHGIGETIAPAGAVKAQLMLRLINVPDSEWVAVDNLRIAEADNTGWARNLHLERFETNFDPWDLDHHLIFERFGIAEGGTMVNEWKEAKVGEVFFRINGTRKPMQYSMWIDNLNVRPSQNYIFEAYYKATEDFKFNGHGILIFFFRDKTGKTIGQSRFHIRPTNGEWKAIFHAFTTPKECVLLDIALNTRNMRPEEYVQLDHIRFYPGAKSVQLKTSIDPDKKSLSFMGCLIGGDESTATAKGFLELMSADGKELLQRIPATPGQFQDYSLTSLKDGNYQLCYQIECANNKKYSSEKKSLYIFNHPDWCNDIGIQRPEAQPPIPWRPLKAAGSNGVQTWQNAYIFQNNLMPKDIGNLLSEAVKMTVNNNSGNVVQSNDAIQIKPSLATGKCVIDYPSLRSEIHASVDYTGFLRYDIKFTASAPVELSSMSLEFALKELAFLHRSDDSWTNIGAVVLKPNQKWNTSHFYNELQFGTENAGIVFYAPKLYPATSDFAQNWAVVEEKTGRVLLNLVNAPRKLDTGECFTIQFALASYPFRPASEHWKTMRFRSGKDSNTDLVWQTSPLFRYAGSIPTVRDEKGIEALLSDSSMQWLFYQFPFYIMDTIPQWSYFEKHWRAQPSRAYDMRDCAGGMGVKGDIRQRSWQDFYMKEFQNHLSRFKWSGVYYDCFGTDIFSEHGELFHPTFETRLFQERIYCEQRRLNPKTITITHLGAAQFGTAAAFSDVVLMGEQYRDAFSKHTYYTEFLTLEEFRAENCAAIGPSRMLLPQYRQSEQMRSPAICTHVVGMALAHNLMLYPNFIHKETQLNIRQRLYAFGLNDSTFHAYWKTGDTTECTSNNPAVKISYYRNAKGIFATLLNPTGQPQNLNVNTAPNLQNLVVYDAIANQEMQFDASRNYLLPPYMALFIYSQNK